MASTSGQSPFAFPARRVDRMSASSLPDDHAEGGLLECPLPLLPMAAQRVGSDGLLWASPQVQLPAGLPGCQLCMRCHVLTRT